jgi:hypothetical protein
MDRLSGYICIESMNQSQQLYEELQQNLSCGWNTWDTRSVLTHVHLPSGLAFRLGIKEYRDGGHLREALIGRLGEDAETVVPGARAWDGAYTSLKVTWRGVAVEVQTAVEGEDWLCLVTPLSRERQVKIPLLIVEAGFYWNFPGSVAREGSTLEASTREGQTWHLGASAAPVEEPQTSALGPYLALPLDTPLALFTGKQRSLEEVNEIMEQRRLEVAHDGSDEAELRSAIQTCMAWDTIYDPSKKRVISPVSRIWSSRQGGWVLFCGIRFLPHRWPPPDRRSWLTPTPSRFCARKLLTVLCPTFRTLTASKASTARSRRSDPLRCGNYFNSSATVVARTSVR